MSITKSKKIISFMKSCLHIAGYILLGLLLAFIINSAASSPAAESNYTANDAETEVLHG